MFSRIGYAVALFCSVAAAQPPFSTFDLDADGWTVISNDMSGIQLSDEGNPGGCVRYIDASPAPARFEAPPKFLGERSAYYGGLIRWDAYSETSELVPSEAVILIGGTTTNLWLYFTPPPFMGGQWTPRRVPLVASVGWLVGQPHSPDGDTPATETQMREVLSNLEHLRLPTDYIDGFDSARMDNVALLTEVESTLTIRLVGQSNVEVCWLAQTGRVYQLQHRTLTPPDAWTNVGASVPGTGSILCLTESRREHTQQFYRVVTLE
jgi:Laminin B (Domain IV)